MTTPLREALGAALSGEPALSRLQFHALLFRFCAGRIGAIRNCLREPDWGGPLLDFQRQATLALAQKDWRRLLAERTLQWIPDESDRLLVFCAALLRALDARHRDRRAEIAGSVIDLPSVLGGGRTLFLPPPATPLTDLIPDPQRLRRGPGDYKNDPGEILRLWWRLVALDGLPVQPRMNELDADVSLELARRLEAQDVRFGLASPFAGLSYGIRSDPGRCGPDGVPYHFAELNPESRSAAEADLEGILDRCAAERVDVLCFPELTLDTSLQQRLGLILRTRTFGYRPALIMAGSFHVDSDARWVNRCRVFSGGGRLLFSQDKCVLFRIPAVQAREDPNLCALLGIDHRGGCEDIRLSDSLEIFDGPLGRLAIPICLDYCGDQLRGLLIDAAVNLLLVAAMTPRMEPFRKQARDLGTQAGAATFVTNSAWLLDQLDNRSAENLALAYLPAHPVPVLARDPVDPLWVFSIRELLGLT